MATQTKRTKRVVRRRRVNPKAADEILESVLPMLLQSRNRNLVSIDDEFQLIMLTVRALGEPATLAQISEASRLSLSKTIYCVGHLTLARELTRHANSDGRYTFTVAEKKPLRPLIDQHAEALAQLEGLAKSHPGIARMVQAAVDSFQHLKGALS